MGVSGKFTNRCEYNYNGHEVCRGCHYTPLCKLGCSNDENDRISKMERTNKFIKTTEPIRVGQFMDTSIMCMNGI